METGALRHAFNDVLEAGLQLPAEDFPPDIVLPMNDDFHPDVFVWSDP